MNKNDKFLQPDKAVERAALAGLFRSWFELTADEQKVLVVILALFLTGVAVRYWHLHSVDRPSARTESSQSAVHDIRKNPAYNR